MQAADVQVAMLSRESGSGAGISHAASAFATAMMFSIRDHRPELVQSPEEYAAMHKEMRRRVTALMREIVAEFNLQNGGVTLAVDIDPKRN